MSYYIGFRFGWVRLGKRMVMWSDPRIHPSMRSGRLVAGWRVRVV